MACGQRRPAYVGRHAGAKVRKERGQAPASLTIAAGKRGTWISDVKHLRYSEPMGAGRPHEQAGAAPAMHSPVNWALLGLVIERPSYAYELARRFERTYDGALSLSSVSHIYTALATLRERGLVRDMPAGPSATRSRRRYEATTEGIAEHGEWVVGLVAEERRRQRVLMAQLGALARTPGRIFFKSTAPLTGFALLCGFSILACVITKDLIARFI